MAWWAWVILSPFILMGTLAFLYIALELYAGYLQSRGINPFK